MKFYKAIKGKARKELKMKYMTANEIAEASAVPTLGTQNFVTPCAKKLA